jgi:hypothetical protein
MSVRVDKAKDAQMLLGASLDQPLVPEGREAGVDEGGSTMKGRCLGVQIPPRCCGRCHALL